MKISQNEKEIIRRAQDGDKEAFHLLFDKYKNRVFAAAYSMLRSREDAEDVVQDAFVKAYFSLKKFRQDSSILTWLHRIVHNLCIDEKRKVARQGGLHEELDESLEKEGAELPGSRADGPQDILLRRERAKKIQVLLGRLRDEHRQVIMLREIDGLSYEEIAQALRISKGTVMSRLYYARRKLQEGLKDYAPTARNTGDERAEAGDVDRKLRVGNK